MGAAVAGPIASRLSPRQSLQAYIGLELGVVARLVLPYELSALTPVLRWAYVDGDPSLFIRVTACLIMVSVPAVALGATFPMAIRWLANVLSGPRDRAAPCPTNTVGAAAGALLAGFILIPRIGIASERRLCSGMAASLVAAACVWVVLRGPVSPPPAARPARTKWSPPATSPSPMPAGHGCRPSFLAFRVLHHCHEIAWTRILSLVLGPTTYAFAAALAAVIAGVALGSGAGTWIVRGPAGPRGGWRACCRWRR